MAEDRLGHEWVNGQVNGRVNGQVNGRLTEAPEGARWSLRECTAAGRAAAEVGACASPDAPPSRRGLVGYLMAMGKLCTRFAIVGWVGR